MVGESGDAPLFPLPVFGRSLRLCHGGGARVVWTVLRGIMEVLRGMLGHHPGVGFVVAVEKICMSQVSPVGSLPRLVGAGWAVFVQHVGGCSRRKLWWASFSPLGVPL